MHRHRTYRNKIHNDRLKSFRVTVQETDLYISASTEFIDIAREIVLQYRGYIEKYIDQHPDFVHALVPFKISEPAPQIIADMIDAGIRTGVGPMASVAGAIAEHVGRALGDYAEEIIVENGGDVYIQSKHPITIGIFANRSPLSLRIGLRLEPRDMPIAVCTSSGTVGHSISFGKADAACVVSSSCPLADAAATSIGNRIKNKNDIASAIDFGKNIKGVKGIVIIKDDKIGIWGNLTTVPVSVRSP
jgi:ApbE superfamily uncharacterized protein (UPF0280 family)